jgi:signal peptidase I
MTKEGGIFTFLFATSLSNAKTIRFLLTGTSMQPSLREGDILTAKPITYHEAEVGDILAYQNLETNKIIVHRLVKKIKYPGADMMLTMAETGCVGAYDFPLKPDNCIIAKVIAIERSKRVINLMTRSELLKGKIISYLMLKLPFIIAIRSKCHMAIKRPHLIHPKIQGFIKNIAKCVAR